MYIVVGKPQNYGAIGFVVCKYFSACYIGTKLAS